MIFNYIFSSKYIVVPKINTEPNSYLNPTNATSDVKGQLSPLSGNPENMNNPFEAPLDHSKFALFSGIAIITALRTVSLQTCRPSLSMISSIVISGSC